MAMIVRFLAICALVLVGASAHAQSNYPNKPVRILVGFAPGGPTDVIARIVAQKLSESLHEQFVVENINGAGGNIANGQAARAAPDGYTLVVVSTGFMVNASLYAKIPYDPIKDFAPISLVAASPNVLVVTPTVPAKSVKELIALVKANPGKYSFAHAGIGSTPHLSGELFKLTFGLDLAVIPFPGAAPAITSTIAGHTPIAFTALPPVISNVKEGKLRALAVLATKRVASLPDVPTMAEAGVPNQEADTITGLLAPAGTPKAIIDRINREIVKMAAQPDVKEKLTTLGFIPIADSPAEFSARIKVEMDKWAKVVHAAKLRIE